MHVLDCLSGHLRAQVAYVEHVPHGSVLGLQHQLRSLGIDPSDPSTAAQLAQIAVDGFGRTLLQSIVGDSACNDAALARQIHQVLKLRSGPVAEHAALIASLALAAIDAVVLDTETSAEVSSATEEELRLVV